MGKREIDTCAPGVGDIIVGINIVIVRWVVKRKVWGYNKICKIIFTRGKY